MPKNVLFVHGYSETSLGAYFQFPSILKSAQPQIEQVGLAAFDSLDDGITIDDLANAMEIRVSFLENTRRWDLTQTGLICHSTGALIARRWIVNRLSVGKALPSHLITMAGANHGSTLAHMGKSVLGYVQKLVLHHELSVGKGVLTDLEYGSDFLLRLNSQWLDAWNNGSLDKLFAFSMGGDTPGGDPTLEIFWQTSEPGSDNTVRISGANLNYTIITATHDENGTTVTAHSPTRRVPHRVLSGYSHFGDVSGILGHVSSPADPPMSAVVEALAISTPEDYSALQTRWDADLAQWTNAHGDIANATAVFTLLDRNGRSIDDCMISILDQSTLGDPNNALDIRNTAPRSQAMLNASLCVLRHSPIQNDTQSGSYAFYLNYAQYLKSSPHWFQIDISNDALIGQHKYTYAPLLFTRPPDLTHTISPNEFTYLGINLGRDSNESYGIYGWDAALSLPSITFPPFPPTHRIAP